MLDRNEWFLIVEQRGTSSKEWIRQQPEYQQHKEVTEEIIEEFSKVCTTAECGKKTICRGLCQQHYKKELLERKRLLIPKGTPTPEEIRREKRRAYIALIRTEPERWARFLQQKREYYQKHKDEIREKNKQYVQNIKINHPERYAQIVQKNRERTKEKYWNDPEYHKKVNQRSLERAIKRERGEQLLKKLKEEKQKQMSPEHLWKIIGYTPGNIDTPSNKTI